MKIKRYVSAGFGMIPADDGEWVMWSEFEPVVKRLHDISLALVVAESKSAELEEERKALEGAADVMESLADKYHEENIIARDLLRWRKVEDGVPENQKTVLVRLKNGDFDVGFFDPEDGWRAPDSDEFYSRPTHWRPIGPLPTTTEGEK